MPIIPTSDFIQGLRINAAAHGDTELPDTIVVRGYPGPPTDVLYHARAILSDHGAQLSAIDDADIDAVGAGGNRRGPWRIYLSGRRDSWIEVPSWERHVVFERLERNTDRVEAYTLWLRAREPGGGPLIHYRVVSIDTLSGPDDEFVAGRLIEDYMAQGGSNMVVWDEQQFGPTTGKPSTKHCF